MQLLVLDPTQMMSLPHSSQSAALQLRSRFLQFTSALSVVPKRPFNLPLTQAPCRNFYKFGLGLRAGVGIAQGCLTEGLLSFLINLSILWSMSETASTGICGPTPLLGYVVPPLPVQWPSHCICKSMAVLMHIGCHIITAPAQCLAASNLY